ncbi:MAG TPA: hypothetical protein VN651_14990 [Gemmatimonadaceae bacterium]|nr:hypothetical protein [Gemmatimonadaceae bacterium]
MRRLPLALLVSPLAAPLAVWLGSIVRGVVSHQVSSGVGNPVAASLILLFALVLFSAPVAYASTLLIVWPAAVFLRALGVFRWWSMAIGAGAAGAALFPLYLHALEPRGSFSFFPGAGAVAGAAAGWAFWFIVARGDPAAETPPGARSALLADYENRE